ncbi:MAG TPA: lysylphosphatidylglycerol synthase transmembrane domain-containing protein [Gemmatimonadales bacterium]
MKLHVRLILLAIGLGLASLIFAQIGIDTLLQHLATAGWVLLPACAAWGLVYTLSTWAWRATLPAQPGRPTFGRAWAINVTCFGLNFLTPVIALGGEAYRAATVAPWLGRGRAVGSVVQYRLLHSLAHVLFVLSALLPGALLLPATGRMFGVLGLTALLGGALTWFLVRRHQEGVLEASLDLLLALPLIRRLCRPLATKRDALRMMDRQIITLYHEHPAEFRRALGLEYLSRFVMAFELALIIWSLGLGWRIGEAFVAGALFTVITNLMFFIPFEAGTREGGLLVAFSLLGLGGEHGVVAALVTRLREIFWALAGLGLLWAGGPAVEPAEAVPPPSAARSPDTTPSAG